MEHTKFVRSKKPKLAGKSFELFINGRNFLVNATPFTNGTGDMQYRISYNNGPVHVFSWDNGLNRYAEADAQADVIPPVIEMAIAEKINEYASELQHAA